MAATEERIEEAQEEHLVLTVEEAAHILRIGRSAAYEQARRYLATGGAEGLPVVRLGRSLRVPRHALEKLLALNGSEGNESAGKLLQISIAGSQERRPTDPLRG